MCMTRSAELSSNVIFICFDEQLVTGFVYVAIYSCILFIKHSYVEVLIDNVLDIEFHVLSYKFELYDFAYHDTLRGL